MNDRSTVSDHNMGQPASKAVRKSTGIVVTLDALGTIYKFKKPVTTQYLELARQAGVKQDIKDGDLKQAFRRAYQEQVEQHPNYGLGTLKDPSEWWEVLVRNTFGQLIDDMPKQLPRQLYDHFSSANAYELHPDVRPFLESMHNLRSQFSAPSDPAILTGIITNSDPRASQVLRALSLNVGHVVIPTREEIRDSASETARTGTLKTPWSDDYNIKNDFDFLVSSYEAGAEKPNPEIFSVAEFYASAVAISRSQKDMELPEGRLKSIATLMGSVLRNTQNIKNMKWIHIGDEYEKDYLGARTAGRGALLLDREGIMDVEADKVDSLEAAASVINVMAEELGEWKT